jgi:hypothetical protein
MSGCFPRFGPINAHPSRNPNRPKMDELMEVRPPARNTGFPNQLESGRHLDG